MPSLNSGSAVVHIPVEVSVKHGATMVLAKGHALELDAEGMYLRLDQELPLDARAVITFMPQDQKALIVTAKVLWCEKLDHIYDCGVILDEPNEAYHDFVVNLERKIEDRRAVKRYPKVLKVAFKSRESFYREMTTNISSGGLFIRTNNPLDEMTELDLELEVPGLDEPIHVKARVVFVLRPEQAKVAGHPPGMGVEFIKFRQGDDLRFYIYLDKLKKIYGK